jgi:hypothetical protein
MNTINIRAAALAVLVTFATLGSLGTIANSEHRDALAAADQQATAVAAAQPQAQQIVIVGRRIPA